MRLSRNPGESGMRTKNAASVAASVATPAGRASAMRGAICAAILAVAGGATAVLKEAGILDRIGSGDTTVKAVNSAPPRKISPKIRRELRLILVGMDLHARRAFLYGAGDLELLDIRSDDDTEADIGDFEAGTAILNDVVGYVEEGTRYGAYINRDCEDCCYDQCLIVEQESDASMVAHIKPNVDDYTVNIRFPHIWGGNSIEFSVRDVEPHRTPELINAVSDLMTEMNLWAAIVDFEDDDSMGLHEDIFNNRMASVLMRFGNVGAEDNPYPPL